MRTHTCIAFSLAILLAFALGCNGEPSTTALRLELSSPLAGGGRTLIPVNQSLDIHSYVIQGTGPGGKTFSVTTVSPQIVIEGLVLGTWTISATGRNQQGTELVHGSITHQLTSSSTRADLFMDTLVGTGTLHIDFHWDEPGFPGMTLNAYLTAQGGLESQITSGITVDVATATAVLEKSLPAGSYEIRFELFSGGVKVDGGTEALRIVKDIQTSGTIALHVDTQLASAPGYTLSTNLTTPVIGSIENIGSSILPNTSVTATFNHISGGGSPDITVRWFLDGQQFATGLSASFSTFTGMHRLDAIASSTRPGSMGSASHSFSASVQGNNGLPILLGRILDGELDANNHPFNLAGVSDAAFLSDGKLLVASNNRLQLCKVEQDELVVVRDFTENAAGSNPAASPYPVNGITAIDVDLFDDIVCTTSADLNTLVCYSYNPETGDLTKIGWRTGNTGIDEYWYRMSNPVLDSARNLLYFFDSDPANNYLYYYRYDDTSLQWLGASPIDSINNVPCTQATELSISGNGRHLGIVCPGNNSFHLMNTNLNDITGNPQPAMWLDRSAVAETITGQVHAIGFRQVEFAVLHQDGITWYTTSDNGGTWSRGPSISLPGSGASDMVFTNAYDSGYIACGSVNPGIDLVAFGSDGLPVQSGFTPSDTHPTAKISISSANDLLVATGTSNDLMLWRISD